MQLGKHLVDLYIEVTFLRLVLNKILEKNPSLSENLSSNMFEPLREESILHTAKIFGLKLPQEPIEKEKPQ